MSRAEKKLTVVKQDQTAAGLDCRNRTELGPKALDWLRVNVKPFAVMEAEAHRIAAERQQNLRDNGRA
jgi:hypothetical protein